MQYINVKKVARRYGLSVATVWRLVKLKNFPAPVKLSPGCTRWCIADLESWEAEKGGEK